MNCGAHKNAMCWSSAPGALGAGALLGKAFETHTWQSHVLTAGSYCQTTQAPCPLEWPAALQLHGLLRGRDYSQETNGSASCACLRLA